MAGCFCSLLPISIFLPQLSTIAARLGYNAWHGQKEKLQRRQASHVRLHFLRQEGYAAELGAGTQILLDKVLEYGVEPADKSEAAQVIARVECGRPMPQFSLKRLFAFTTLAAVEFLLLTFIIGPRIRTYVHGSWGSIMVCVWILFGAFLGWLVFGRREGLGACLGAITHFVIAMVGLFNYR